MEQRRDANFVQILGRKIKVLTDDDGKFCDASGMAARVRILFVDGGGKHADRAQEEIAILFRSLLQLLDEFLDVAGHAVKRFGQLADFRRALHWSALAKISAADGARRSRQSPDRRADANGE